MEWLKYLENFKQNIINIFNHYYIFFINYNFQIITITTTNMVKESKSTQYPVWQLYDFTSSNNVKVSVSLARSLKNTKDQETKRSSVTQPHVSHQVETPCLRMNGN